MSTQDTVKWDQLLSSTDDNASADAANTLLKLVQCEELPVHVVSSLLRSLNVTVRERAAWILGELAAAALPAIDSIIEGLSDPSWKVRYYCAELFLLDFGQRTVRGLVRIIHLLGDENDNVAELAVRVLSKADSQHFSLALTTQTDTAQENASSAVDPQCREILRYANQTAMIASPLLNHMEHGPVSVRLAKVVAGARLGAVGLPILLQALADPDNRVRKASLGAIGPAVTRILSLVLKATNETSDDVRAAALDTLQRVAGAVHDTANRTRQLLEDPSPQVRWRAIHVIRSLHAIDAPALLRITHLVRDSDEAVGETASLTLSDGRALASAYGLPNEEVVRLCVALACDTALDDGRRADVLYALSEMAPLLTDGVRREIWRDIRGLLDHPDSTIRFRVMLFLKSMCVDDYPDTAELLPRLDDPDSSVRGLACRLLRKLAGKGSAAVDKLRELMLNDSDELVRVRAAMAMREVCPTNQLAEPIIRAARESPFCAVRKEVEEIPK